MRNTSDQDVLIFHASTIVREEHFRYNSRRRKFPLFKYIFICSRLNVGESVENIILFKRHYDIKIARGF